METMIEQTNEITTKKNKKKSSIASWIRFFLFLALIFFIFRFAFSLTVISGESMSPTFHDGNLVFSSNIFYTPERNDIIIFSDPKGFSVIKRIVGLPGETVEIKNGTVFINDHILHEAYITGTAHDMEKVTIDEDHYFVMGDNRVPGESLDSRDKGIGPIPRERIQGEVVLSINPFKSLQ